MVDFNNETTISKPPKEVVALIIIEKIYNFLEADEDWSKKRLIAGTKDLTSCRSRLRTLFLITHDMIKTRLDESVYEAIREICLEPNTEVTPDDLIEAFGQIMQVMYKVGLTKIDTKPGYDRNSIEKSNKAQGYG